ncbi:NADH:flavin oxidoreductase/NADH oxidase family protein [Nocardioides sp. R-C-SC26]|uniref:NADH:flavin oxidoreductase/NADH oxidase family protein n=1 Tax=Nocardioides sp. R-C-SC26 TaxID=2870414 RepID=UPI001E367B62|nr:NADH:flavin oxidoreductase/NADH oxidase family protein [Nocardioides sp. R-C-SC26]
MTTHLSRPLTLPSGQAIPNRFMKSALSESLGDRDCGPTAKLERLYRRWADGGFGLVVTGNVMVDRRHRGEPGNVVVEDERHLDGLRGWTATFAESDARLWMQVNHPGRQANALVSGRQPVAPSAIKVRIPGAAKPRALTDTEIHQLVERYATTARIAQSAGFDGVQLHGAHGYLITQFLSPLSNQRTDAWGGDAERRRRFVLEVLRATRAATGPEFAIGIKLNSADFQRGGFSEEESRDVVSALVAEGIDLIEVSGGTYEAPAMMGTVTKSSSTIAREAYFLEYAAALRELAPHTPIAVTGGFRSAEAMEGAVADGHCDVVGLGRPAAVVPDSADAVLSGAADRLPSHGVQMGARAVTGRFMDLRTADGGLDLAWHTDQLHRIGAGKEPDPRRGWKRTTAAMVIRNGPQAFRAKRG